LENFQCIVPFLHCSSFWRKLGHFFLT
jgi:hypothetical protein